MTPKTIRDSDIVIDISEYASSQEVRLYVALKGLSCISFVYYLPAPLWQASKKAYLKEAKERLQLRLVQHMTRLERYIDSQIVADCATNGGST